MSPSDRRYTREHEWARLDSDLITIGITDFAQHQLGDVVYVELPKVGAALTAGRPFGVVESVKAASDIFSPIGGQVVEVNGALDANPDIVNKDPFGEGWMVKARPSGPDQLDTLMSAEDYDRFTEGEQSH